MGGGSTLLWFNSGCLWDVVGNEKERTVAVAFSPSGDKESD